MAELRDLATAATPGPWHSVVDFPDGGGGALLDERDRLREALQAADDFLGNSSWEDEADEVAAGAVIEKARAALRGSGAANEEARDAG